MSNPPNLCGVFGDDEHPKVVGARVPRYQKEACPLGIVSVGSTHQFFAVEKSDFGFKTPILRSQNLDSLYALLPIKPLAKKMAFKSFICLFRRRNCRRNLSNAGHRGMPPLPYSGCQERLLSRCEPDLILIHKVVQNRLMLRLFGEIPSFHHNGAIVLLGADGILHNFYEAGLHLLRSRVFGV